MRSDQAWAPSLTDRRRLMLVASDAIKRFGGRDELARVGTVELAELHAQDPGYCDPIELRPDHFRPRNLVGLNRSGELVRNTRPLVGKISRHAWIVLVRLCDVPAAAVNRLGGGV